MLWFTGAIYGLNVFFFLPSLIVVAVRKGITPGFIFNKILLELPSNIVIVFCVVVIFFEEGEEKNHKIDLPK
jgi:hypothetical protein